MSQRDVTAGQPQAEPQLPAPALLVTTGEAPLVPPPAGALDQRRTPPRLRLGMGAEHKYRGFLADRRGAVDEGRPFVVGVAAVMLFGAALAYRRRAERARAIALRARVRTHPRRS